MGFARSTCEPVSMTALRFHELDIGRSDVVAARTPAPGA
jgi:hypothetical protein